MTGDISKKTVAALLVLAIILSASLTLMTLKKELKKPDEQTFSGSPDANTKVSVTVLESPSTPEPQVNTIDNNQGE